MADKVKNYSKIITAILIALMSAYSTYMSTHANNKSDILQKANLDQMNKVTIPQIKKEIEEGESSTKELAKEVLTNRERLARLEGVVEGLPSRLTRRTLRTLPNVSHKHSKLRKAANKPVEVIIPDLDQNYIQQALKGVE